MKQRGDDADYPSAMRFSVASIHADLLAHGALARPEKRGGGAAQDGSVAIRRRVVLQEPAAFQQPDPHGGEIAGADAIHFRRKSTIPRLCDAFVRSDQAAVILAAERERVHGARGFDAGYG